MIQRALNLLGYKVKDKVSGYVGVVESVSFDLYGCIVADVRPQVTKNEMLPGRWMDINRLEPQSKTPVMMQPSFVAASAPPEPVPHKKGSAEKSPR